MKQPTAKNFFIPLEDLEKIWPHGRVWIGRLPVSADPGGYFRSKAYLYPERVQYYPPQMRLYRCSSGIRRPAAVEMDRTEINQLVCDLGYGFVDRRAYDVVQTYPDGTERVLSSTMYETYERKLFRRPCVYKKPKQFTPMGATILEKEESANA